jgi:hypothetical protein
MKTIQLQIDDNNYDSFLIIIQNLKDGFIKKFVVNDTIETVSDEEQKDIENILDSISEEDKKVAFSKTIQIDI